MTRLVLLALVAALAGCAAPGPAPVRDAQNRPSTPPKAAVREEPRPEPLRPAPPQIAASTNGLHTVARGDTLYAIAFANNQDHRDLALWNRLESPDRILVGQVLRLTPPPGMAETRPLDEAPQPAAKPIAEIPLLRAPQGVLLAYSEANWAQVSGSAPAAPSAGASATVQAVQAPASAPEPAEVKAGVAKPAAEPASPEPAAAVARIESWQWPAEGTLIGRFGAAGGKGIDLVGARNSPIKAVAPGKVVYSGSGLRGYGQLIIVKHAGEFLSAYAHNESILVKEGETVSAGQKIALMGDSGADRVKLHFEIRRYGKPLDPLAYLPERS